MKASAKTLVRVLIADDQPSAAAILAELVTQCRNEVVGIVGSGLEAIQAYERHQPDVVLMDYQMSKLNGVTACRQILAKNPRARIILVSGFTPPCEPKEVGAIAILIKPVQLHRLYEALHTAAHGDANLPKDAQSGPDRRHDVIRDRFSTEKERKSAKETNE